MRKLLQITWQLYSKNNNLKNVFTSQVMINVPKKLPINPSHVFYGASFNNYVWPNSFPKLYAKISLKMTTKVGNTNLKFN